MLKIFCDGGARGNPGPAAGAFVVFDSQGEEIYRQGMYLGEATNNLAEYAAVKAAIEWLGKNYPDQELEFFLDSTLIVNQLNGKFKIKNDNLKNIYQEIKKTILDNKLKVKNFNFIYREKNYLADLLVNEILDKQNSV